MGLENAHLIELDRYHRLPKRYPNKTRPVIVRFANFNERMDVWGARLNLKGTDQFVHEDFSIETLAFQ